MNYQRKRVAKRLASGLLAGALALGGLAISGGTASAKTPSSPSTQRLSGADRYETSVAIARNQVGATGPTAGLVIATGENPTDALAAASLTAAGRPMLLVKKDSVPQSVADFITDFKSVLFVGQPTIFVIGGTNAVSAAVATALGTLATTTGDTTPPLVTRISGDDRYATAKAINDVAGITNATDTMIIVNGEDGKWADALSAGPIASENTWPIVTTNSTGLQASAKASVDAYLALPGSSKKFLIIGGPASVSNSVEEYLIGSKLVAPANIRRIGGLDRYHTNFLTNLYLAAPPTQWGGGKLALVSGEAPYDALAAAGWAAANNTHLVMTPSAGGNTFVTTLAGALNATSELGSNSQLWVLGGRTAVSDAARTGYIAAASAEDMTATLSGCVVGKASAVLTLSGRLTATEFGRTSLGAYMSLNAGTPTGSALVDRAIPGETTRKTFTVTLSAGLSLGDTLRFSGFTEGATVSGTSNYVHQRSIASATCTAALDTARPTAELRVITGSTSGVGVTTSVGAVLLLSTNEPVTLGGVDVATTPTTVTGSAITFGGTALTKNVSVTDISGSDTDFVIQLASDETATLSASAPYSVVNITASWIKDKAVPVALSPAVDVITTSAPDVTGPVLTAIGVTCTATSLGAWTATDLTLTAVATKALDGAVANQYSLSVVNSRGLLKPSVKVDATAKTITVTADTGYHTVADIDNELDNAGIDSINVTAANLTANGAKRVSATVLPAISLAGEHTCTVAVNGNEPFFLGAGLTVAVGGLSAGYVGTPTLNYVLPYDATGSTADATWYAEIKFTSKLLGAGSIGFNGLSTGLLNQKGVPGGTPMTFTAA